MKTILNMLENAARGTTVADLNKFAEVNGLEIGAGKLTIESVQMRLEQAQETMLALFTGRDFKNERLQAPFIGMREALTTNDVSIVMPRVITTILQEPVEPALFLQTSVAEELTFPEKNPNYIEFPTVGAMAAAGEVAENGEYPNATLSFGLGKTSLKIKKYGLMAALSEEVVDMSIYPLIAMHMRMMKAAVDRKIESILFNTMTDHARTVFDNESLDTTYHTTGVAQDQTANYSFDHFDLIKMCASLVANKYNASHVLAHPMSWAIWAMDPHLRANFFHMGQIGGNVWNIEPRFDQQVNIPFGLTYVPYYALAQDPQTQLAAGAGSGLDATLLTDVYVIDKANSLFLATKGDSQLDSNEDWYKDAKVIKIRKYAAAAAKDGGNGMTVAKRIRVERNWKELFTVRMNS